MGETKFTSNLEKERKPIQIQVWIISKQYGTWDQLHSLTLNAAERKKTISHWCYLEATGHTRQRPSLRSSGDTVGFCFLLRGLFLSPFAVFHCQIFNWWVFHVYLLFWLLVSTPTLGLQKKNNNSLLFINSLLLIYYCAILLCLLRNRIFHF